MDAEGEPPEVGETPGGASWEGAAWDVEVEIPSADETVGLAKRARDGDAEALNELIGRHQDWLQRVIRIKLGGPSARARQFFETMDVAQETLQVVAEKIGQLEVRSAGGVRQWLAKIAGLKLKDLLKYRDAELRNPARQVPLGVEGAESSASVPGLQLASGEDGPPEQLSKQELTEILDEAVAQLPEDYQEVVLLRDYAKESWDTIRERLDKPSVGAAKQLYLRAWIKIRASAAPRLASDFEES